MKKRKKRVSNEGLLHPLAEGYLEYVLEVRRRSRETVKDIRCTLRGVSERMAHIRPDVTLWKLDLNDYLRWLRMAREEGASEGTLAKRISHLRGLLDYAWRSGRSDRNVLDGFQLRDSTHRKQPRSLSIEEARQLVEACHRDTPEERRDRIVILLLYGCGLRTKELYALRVQDVDRERKELFIRHGKGDRERVVPIPAAVHIELLAYLLERGGKQGPLFRAYKTRTPLAAKRICSIVRRAAEVAGIKGPVTPKVLRHSYATHLMDRGVDLAVIASLMGHRSPAETGVYLHVLKGRTQAAVDCLDTKKGEMQ